MKRVIEFGIAVKKSHMKTKKIVISPNNSKAIAFFEDLNRKKAETFKKIDSLSLFNNKMKKVIEYHYKQYGSSLFSSPEFDHKEIVEVSTEKQLQDYIEKQKDPYGNFFKKKASFQFDYISNQGGVKVKNYVPNKIKKV